MAALNLLPRELLSFITARPAWPILPAFACRAAPARHVDFMHHWPRFRSSLSTKLDHETAREFDRPQKGYSHPTIPGAYSDEHGEESFMEDVVLSSSQSQMSQPLSLAVPENEENAYFDMYQAISAKRFDEALYHLRRAPHVRTIPAVIRRTARNYVKQLQASLLNERPTQLDELRQFALQAVSLGFMPYLRHHLLVHLARFTRAGYAEFFERYMTLGDTHEIHATTSPTDDRQASLRRSANAVIRALSLAANLNDAVKVVLLSRRLLSPAGHNMTVIEAFTYQLLLDEASKSENQNVLEAVSRLVAQDWPAIDVPEPALPPSLHASPNRQTVIVQSALQHYRRLSAVVEGGQIPSVGAVNRLVTFGIQLRQANAGHRTPLVADRLSDLNSGLRVNNTQARKLYMQILTMIRNNETPSAVILKQFHEICHKQYLGHLHRDVVRRLAIPESQKTLNKLVSDMQSGLEPPAGTIMAFITEAHRARMPFLIDELGQWMTSSSRRLASLWHTARMYHLVQLGRASRTHSRQALKIFTDEFMMIGVPIQLEQFVNRWVTSTDTNRETPAVRRKVRLEMADNVVITPPRGLRRKRHASHQKLWPSSHTITIALDALFQQCSLPDFVYETYMSFLNKTYGGSNDQLPLSLLPDQVTFMKFIEPLTRSGRTIQALDILHDMRQRGIDANVYHWTAILGGFAKEGNDGAVENIMKRMTAAATDGSNTALPSDDANVPMSTSPATPAFKNGLEQLNFVAPTVAVYSTIILGFSLAKKLPSAIEYRRQLYAATDEEHGRLYRYGESSQADKALAIVSSMDKLRLKGTQADEQMGNALAAT